MRDYINRLSRGKSIIEVPKLTFENEQAVMNVDCGKCTEGNFTFTASVQTAGKVYSDNERVNVITQSFNGTDINISYVVNAEGIEEKDNIEGNFTVVSNAGEKVIPFVFICEPVTVKKPEPQKDASINADTAEVRINISDEKYKGTITIEKNGHGTAEVNIYSEVDFIETGKNVIGYNEFVGDRYEAEYFINPEKLHAGNNFGYICIDTYRQHFRIPVVVVHNEKEVSDQYDVRLENKKAVEALTRYYLDFRMKKIKKEKWISESLQIIDRIRGIKGSDPFYDIAQVQLFAMSGREEEASQMMELLKKDMLGRIGDDVEMYCYFLYVSTLLVKEEEYTQQVNRQVKKFFENGYDTYRLLWILFYLDADTESNKSIRLVRIKDIVNEGCTSPVIYLEAINILNAQPVLLRVLNRFEIRVINFGCRYGIINEKLAMQIADVAASEKNGSYELVSLLKKLNEQFGSDEILTSLVSHMIRLGLTGEQYFDIYELGVLRGLRITRLYEFYIASMRKDVGRQLPKIVMMYFSYDNTLVGMDKAFLYANIITGRDSYYKDIYSSFEKDIEIYVYEQLKAGNINDYLVILYKALLGTQLITEETNDFICRLRYVYKIQCFSSYVKEISVTHTQLTDKCGYEFTGTDCYIYMYNTDAAVEFLCCDGKLRNSGVDYEIEKVFDDEEYKEVFAACDDTLSKEAGVLVSRACRLHKMQIFNDQTLMCYKTVKKLPGINEAFRQTINSWMIDYYRNHYELDDFWHEYPFVDTERLSSEDAKNLIEILIDSSMYSQAYELVCIYGCSRVAVTKLLKMTDYILKNVSDSHNDVIDEITAYIFREHIYNEPVLSYMSEFFNGTNEEMYEVWKAGLSYGVNVTHLSERLLAQMMYTGVHSGRFTEVFSDYYSKMPDMLIVKAYLSYNAQLYLIRQKKANDIVFRVIEECMEDGTGLPECCYVAWLKNISKNTNVLEDEKKKKYAQGILDELCANDRIYAFYKKFNGVLDMPYNVLGITVLECIASPESKVTITYTTGSDNQQYTQIMKSNGWGIYTCRFNLFYGDEINYNYTVTGNKEENVSEKYNFRYEEVNPDTGCGRFDAINDCLASRQLHDMATLKKLMRSYAVEEYVSSQMFKIVK